MERGTRTGKRTADGLTDRPSKNGKISGGTRQNTTPPTTKKSVSVRGLCAYKAREPNHYPYLMSYICVWTIGLSNYRTG